MKKTKRCGIKKENRRIEKKSRKRAKNEIRRTQKRKRIKK